jgi:hypothetical protein
MIAPAKDFAVSPTQPNDRAGDSGALSVLRGQTDDSDDIALRPTESVPLLSAWVSRLAARSGVRALVIKGPLMAVQGLRRERDSGDVDLWVDPSRWEEFGGLLEGYGWSRVQNDRPGILPDHARTMRHERWACELDLHDRFPGFFADPADVFDRLWELRTHERLAGAEVTTATRAGNAAVLALHLLRDLRPGAVHDEYAFLIEVTKGFTAEEQLVLRELVASCGANETLAPFLDATGLTPLPGLVVPTRDLDDWTLLTRTRGAPTVYWLHRISRTPWWRWPGLIWRSFWMTDQQIRSEDPDAGTSAWAMLRFRLRRLRRGVAMLPRAAWLVVSSRRGSRSP